MNFYTYLRQFYTEQTTKSYQRAVDHFLLHSRSKNKSNYNDILNYISQQKIDSSRVVAALKRYFDYLIFIDEREDHPCRQLIIKRKKQQIQFQDLFSSEELEKLMERKSRYEELKNRNKAIISLLIYQGLSPANIVDLKVSDVDTENGMVYVKSTPRLTRRTLELKAPQILLLFKYIEIDRKKTKADSNKLFIGKLGEPMSVDSLNRMLRPLKSLYRSRNLNANTIRKSVITNWINEDKKPIEDVQLLAGHKWLSTTEQYKKDDDKSKVEMINRWFPL
mgnify:CR=1 FL=1